MICERLTFIIICSVLSHLSVSSSWATTSNVSGENFVQDLAISSLNSNDKENQTSRLSSKTLENNYQIVQPSRANQTAVEKNRSSNSNTLEPSPEINRSWFLVAMAVTATVFLFLLAILFKKPLAQKKTDALSPVTTEPEKEETVITSAHKLEPTLKIDQERLITSPVNSVIDLELKEKFPEDQPRMATKEMATIENSCPQDNIVKINSHPDYIDVGWELIQDLQQSDHNIRRKAIWELAKIGDSRCIEPLMAMMPQANPVDKSLILKAITQITNRNFKLINEQLFALLDDQNPQIKISAIRDLTTFYKFVSPLAPQLTRMQLDEDFEVRHRARQALHKLNLNYSTSMVNDYPGNVNGNLTSEDKDKANHI